MLDSKKGLSWVPEGAEDQDHRTHCIYKMMKGAAMHIYYIDGNRSDPAEWKNISLHRQEKETLSNQVTAYRIQ